MKKFEAPEMGVEIMEVEDVITTSTDPEEPSDPNATPWG